MHCDIQDYLSANPYPGRGILMGRSRDGRHAVIAYFIMGRSENSRNRVFAETDDGIRTQAFDEAKMTDPSLIIYHPVRVFNGCTIVTNGDHTDTIRDGLAAGQDFRRSLMTRTFEPDAPHYTPRISGLLAKDGSYGLSILKTLDGAPSCCCRYLYSYDTPQAGLGHLIHTYEHDGDPLPSFEGEPRCVALSAKDAEELAGQIWDALNAENKVSLMVRLTNIRTGTSDTVIINRHEEAKA